MKEKSGRQSVQQNDMTAKWVALLFDKAGLPFSDTCVYDRCVRAYDTELPRSCGARVHCLRLRRRAVRAARRAAPAVRETAVR